MNFLTRLFGISKTKRTHAREVEVNRLVIKRQDKFTSDMQSLKKQAKDIHRSNTKALKKSKELNIIIRDITSQIAVATGGDKRLRYGKL